MQWKRALPFLLLNIVVSAATTLLVLALWDRTQQPARPITSSGVSEQSTPASVQAPVEELPAMEITLPPADQPVIQIEAVIGAGDLGLETVILKRVGEGELLLQDWKLTNQRGLEYTFPDLKLNKNGSVRVYTRAGQNTVIELFWGMESPAWQSGDTVNLLDPQGGLRASYSVP